MNGLFILQIVFAILKIVLGQQDAPVLKIAQGSIRGTFRETWKGKTFRAFTGIPYGKPPIGSLRFEAPVPAADWEGILDASKPHAMCPQVNVFFNDYNAQGDEDCLYLNVYSPVENKLNSKKFPVMVYIHGGGWTCGDANPEHYGPDFLLEEDVVLVTTNYRIGAFGFLSTEDEVVPGNCGLKDQVLALKWVQKNIKYFGGHASRVTIVGQSAGGASALYHVLSPLSKGLFHGVIAQSGSPLAAWALAKSGSMLKNTRKLAELLNCPTNSNKDMVQCLKKADAFDIAHQDKKFYLIGYEPIAPYMPIVEQERDGAFITRHPMDLIKTGEINSVPIITGITSEDGAILSSALYNDSATIKRLNREFTSLLPSAFQFEDSASVISSSIRKFYFGNHDIDDSTKAQVTKLYTDYYFFLPTDTTVRKLAARIQQPIYYYLFGYHGSMSLAPVFGDSTYNYGVCHCDEFYYLMSRDYFKELVPTEEDKAVRELMVALWTNFAKFGNPTPQPTSVIPVIWNPATSEKGNYYSINSHNDVSMKTNLYNKRMLFWHNIWHKNGLKIEL